jgi:hypothetical protein
LFDGYYADGVIVGSWAHGDIQAWLPATGEVEILPRTDDLLLFALLTREKLRYCPYADIPWVEQKISRFRPDGWSG